MLKNLENMEDKHTGSMTAIIIGILIFLSGVNAILEGIPSGAFAGGLSLTFGALAYRMAKKRKLGAVNPTVIRLILEVASIVLAMLVVFMQNDIRNLMILDPVPNVVIPMGVLIAYMSIVFQK